MPTTESTFTKASVAFPGLLALGAVALTSAANGAYFPQEWGWPALAFTLAALLALLIRDRVPAGRAQLVFVALLAAFAAWTLASIAWASSATEPMESFERVLIYVAFAAALTCVGTAWVLDGVLAAAVLVAAWSLATRHAGDQLAGPIGYWNGLGALAAIGSVLALRSRVRALALVVLLPTLYLTYSRGSWLALACGLAVWAACVPRLRIPLAVVVAVGVVAVALNAHRLWSSFTAPLPRGGADLQQRLGSVSSNGRTEYWRVAWKEVEAHPLLGGGAGSYERWWHRYRDTSFEARNAHNLYLETLAELGPLGLALLLGAFAVPFATRRSPAALAAWTVFVAHAALDWDWQLPAVTLAALACAVVALGEGDRRVERRSLWIAALAPVAVFAVVVQVGNSALARGDARTARRWQPWSAKPWQVLGEQQLAAGDRAAAARSFRHALRLDPTDWSIWADLAEIDPTAARRARLLNPHI